MSCVENKECNPRAVMHIAIFNPGWEVRQGFPDNGQTEGVGVMVIVMEKGENFRCGVRRASQRAAPEGNQEAAKGRPG